MTVAGLIHNLTAFADFYESATAAIERADPFQKRYESGGRDANTDVYQRTFNATPGIDRVRAYVLAHFGDDLTIGTARRVLGDLIRHRGLSVEAAGSLSLDAAMDHLDKPHDTGPGDGSTPTAAPRRTADRPPRDPSQPSKDRQDDILAAIRAAGTPLTRLELIDQMKLKTEGKLGANLAWMVNNGVLVNVPPRGYWPAGEPVPE